MFSLTLGDTKDLSSSISQCEIQSSVLTSNQLWKRVESPKRKTYLLSDRNYLNLLLMQSGIKATHSRNYSEVIQSAGMQEPLFQPIPAQHEWDPEFEAIPKQIYVRAPRKGRVWNTTQVPNGRKLFSSINNLKHDHKEYISSNCFLKQAQKPSTTDKEVGYLGCAYTVNSHLTYSYKEDQNTVYKDAMEDRGKSVDNFNNIPYTTLFTLFDGHGGSGVSEFLQNNFEHFFKKSLLKYPNNLDLVFVDTYTQLNKAWTNIDLVNVGSTGTTVVITNENNKRVIYSANIGDTRCSYISHEKIERLTYEHRACDNNEHKRIYNSGGIIFNDRVMGQLSLTRSFGDFELKSFGVKCDPYLSRKEINESESNKFLIIATDGLWDVMLEQEIYKIINNAKDTKVACAELIEEAKKRGSEENISLFRN